MNRDLLKADLKTDEGLKLKPYRCTAGKLTIGVGRNLDDVGLTEAEALSLLDNDIARAEADLTRNIPWWTGLRDGAQRALLNLAFNMGWPRLSGFTKMLAALRMGDYDTAAAELLDSHYADQVGDRARRLAALIRSA